MIEIEQLLWDSFNSQHILKHGLSKAEVEEVCFSNPISSISAHTQRLRVIGRTAQGKVVTIILAHKGAKTYYVLTARPASRKERDYLNSIEMELS